MDRGVLRQPSPELAIGPVVARERLVITAHTPEQIAGEEKAGRRRRDGLPGVLTPRERIDHARIVLPPHPRGERVSGNEVINMGEEHPTRLCVMRAEIARRQPVPPHVHADPKEPERTRHVARTDARHGRSVIHDDDGQPRREIPRIPAPELTLSLKEGRILVIRQDEREGLGRGARRDLDRRQIATPESHLSPSAPPPRARGPPRQPAWASSRGSRGPRRGSGQRPRSRRSEETTPQASCRPSAAILRWRPDRPRAAPQWPA